MGDVRSPERGYMTVGEAARRAGVTVRSLQYYDQQGVLSPSVKGPQNQRLYTPEDLDRLSCVPCLKYAGLSLGAIREFLEGGSDATEVFDEALRQTEEGFSTLLRRYAVLSNLRGAVIRAMQAGEEPDWRVMACGIETGAGRGDFFWRLSCIYDEQPGEEEAGSCDCGEVGLQGMGTDGTARRDGLGRCDESYLVHASKDVRTHLEEGVGTGAKPTCDAHTRREVVAAWHEAIAEAVGLMRAHEQLDSPRSRQVAAKVVELREADAARPADQRFLLLENMPAAPDAPHDRCFGDLRQEMSAYLDRLVMAYEAGAGSLST